MLITVMLSVDMYLKEANESIYSKTYSYLSNNKFAIKEIFNFLLCRISGYNNSYITPIITPDNIKTN